MRKVVLMFLTAIMCLSLVACGGNGEKNDSEKELNVKDIDVVGTWINMAPTEHGMKMTIEEDGTGSVVLGDQNLDLVWERSDDDTLAITANSKELEFEIGVSDKVVELKWRGTFTRYDMVSEKDYNNMIEKVEITADNWQDYLEVKAIIEPRKDDFNDIVDLRMIYALVLKDDYASRIAAADGAVEYSMGGKCLCPIEYNAATNEYSIGTAYTKAQAEAKGCYIDESNIEKSTDKLSSYQETGFEFGASYGSQPDSIQVNGDIVTADTYYYQNIEITRIQGTLFLKK